MYALVFLESTNNGDKLLKNVQKKKERKKVNKNIDFKKAA